MSPDEFTRALSLVSLTNTFNPYADRCPVYDVRDAPLMRKETLRALLRAAVQVELEGIWIGRDLGYRGGRRTGLALTDDVHLDNHGARWGVSAVRPTKGQVLGERTAAVIWGVLSRVKDHLFLWNVFPLHPHEPDNPFSNRAHNAEERRTGEEILAQLILLLRPKQLVCIGNDAAQTARRLCSSQKLVQVRHPSYGGQTEFLTQVRRLYRLRNRYADTLL